MIKLEKELSLRRTVDSLENQLERDERELRWRERQRRWNNILNAHTLILENENLLDLTRSETLIRNTS